MVVVGQELLVLMQVEGLVINREVGSLNGGDGGQNDGPRAHVVVPASHVDRVVEDGLSDVAWLDAHILHATVGSILVGIRLACIGIKKWCTCRLMVQQRLLVHLVYFIDLLVVLSIESLDQGVLFREIREVRDLLL